MPRYLVFAGDDHYPSGGADDFVGCFATSMEAALAMPHGQDWAHVAELSDHGLVIIASYGEFNPGELKLYPERMAHQRPATTAEAGLAAGQRAEREERT